MKRLVPNREKTASRVLGSPKDPRGKLHTAARDFRLGKKLEEPQLAEVGLDR